MRQRGDRTDAQRRKSPFQTQRVCNFDCIWALSPWNRHTFRRARKCSMRSEIYWFAEFCQSQCLSHLAASFIVTRAEASIAKSCDRMCFVKNKQAENGCLRGYPVTPAQPMRRGMCRQESLRERFQLSPSLQSHSKIQVLKVDIRKWSFRRFTYGNLVTTSPSSEW